MQIKLNDILQIHSEDICEYKLHVAKKSGSTEPLDVFSESFEDWIGWNCWRGGENDFNRKYILSIIHDYHKTNRYLFGGIFRVVKRFDDYGDTEVGYEIAIEENYSKYIGRIEIDFEIGLRGRAFRLENYIDNMVVSQILDKKYQGIDFPGYDNVCLDFATLEMIVTNDKQDWKVALENMKGVYVIVDKSNGKKYIGSAYGESGIWARWKTYVFSDGHGYNDELVELIAKNGVGYARNNFQLAIIELLSMKTDDDFVIHRESFWKNVLQTRGEFGYNKN